MGGIFNPVTPEQIGAVPIGRNVVAGSNMTGGGNLSSDITLNSLGGGGGGFVPVPPIAADFNVEHKSPSIASPTISDNERGIGILFAAQRNVSGGIWKQSYLLKSAPLSTEWRIECFLACYSQTNNPFIFMGLGVGNSLNSSRHLTLQNTLNSSVDKRFCLGREYIGLDANANSAVALEPNILMDGFYSFPLWLSIEYDKPKITYLMSLDGYNWSAVYETLDADTFLGAQPDLIGFSAMSVDSAAGTDYIRATHWQEKTDILDPLGLNT